jgi:hypothetical protein
MKTMNRKEHVTFEDVLDEIMIQESEPTHEALLRWSNRYPEHREELAEFFATWAVQKETEERPAIDEDRVASRMVSHALNLLYQQTHSTAKEAQSSSATRLHRMVNASGLTEEKLMAECDLDETLLAKLDRHLIVFESIPRICIQKLSQALHLAVEEVSRALMGDPIPLGAHKAKGKPVGRQELFLDAVATSDLAENVKKEWERVVSVEKPG